MLARSRLDVRIGTPVTPALLVTGPDRGCRPALAHTSGAARRRAPADAKPRPILIGNLDPTGSAAGPSVRSTIG
jgi:hypothetical protein